MIKPPSPAVPTHWLCYVSVADVDATLARAAAVGCTVLAAPLDIEPRRLAVLADPQRAVFEAVPSGGAFSVLQDNQGATFAVVAFGA
jgi:predicted enzyme related to lactoylglutathione lyase